MVRIKRLLVPTDFSPASDVAFEYALDLAAREGASIHLLNVLDDAFAAVYPDGFYVELPGLRQQLLDQARQRLETMASRCAAASIVATTKVAYGRPAACITDEANNHGSDLIVMATHSRGVVAHLMLGSVAEHVVRTAPCPVLTVRDSSRAADRIAENAVAVRQAAIEA